MGKVIRILFSILIPIICYYFAKKNDRRGYSRSDIAWIVIFSYLWSFLNIFVHECGHALTASIFRHVVNEISVGVGPTLFISGIGKYTEINFQVFPISGYTKHTSIGMRVLSEKVIILAMGVITQFLFLGLVYWLLKRNKSWQKTLIGHFVYHYAVKIAFWLTFFVNFPFVHPKSDWTRIVKKIFRR